MIWRTTSSPPCCCPPLVLRITTPPIVVPLPPSVLRTTTPPVVIPLLCLRITTPPLLFPSYSFEQQPPPLLLFPSYFFEQQLPPLLLFSFPAPPPRPIVPYGVGGVVLLRNYEQQPPPTPPYRRGLGSAKVGCCMLSNLGCHRGAHPFFLILGGTILFFNLGCRRGPIPFCRYKKVICLLIHHISHSFVAQRKEMGRCPPLQAFGCCQLVLKNKLGVPVPM